MKFPFRVLHGLEDAQRNFETLEAKTILDRKLAVGSFSLTFTVANQSAIATVTHGLGTTPIVVFLQDATNTGAGATFSYNYFTVTATTFQAQGNAQGAVTTTRPMVFLAIG